MKTKITTIICTLLMSIAAFSQDLIIYRNGIELNAKVVEITSTEVKYKKLENPDGPVYSAVKADIFMIKYENGTKDVFSQMPVLPAPVVIPSEKTHEQEKDVRPEIRHYGGPRIGVTYVGKGAIADDLTAQGKGNTFSQFGWQFETRMFTLNNGMSGLLEIVPLVGMVDMGKFTPSITGIIGLRLKEGNEFGAGPSVSFYKNAAGNVNTSLGIILATGVSIRSGNVCFPVNIALEPSVTKQTSYYDPSKQRTMTVDYKTGIKLSLLVGFNSKVR